MAIVAAWSLTVVGAGRLPLLAGGVAWRSLMTLGLLVAGLGALVFGLVQSRRRWLVGFSLPLVLLATALFVAHALAPSRAGDLPAGSSGELSILSWNVNGSLVMPDVIAAEVARHDPDVLVLPSIDDGELDQLEQLLRPRGYGAARHSGSQVVVFSRVGYRLEEGHDTSPRQAVVTAPGLPTIVAVHLPIPFFADGNRDWNEDVRTLGMLCDAGLQNGLIVAGDFNATTDNLRGTSLMDRCEDAASFVGASDVGTWPTRLPTVVGIPIDHVFTGPGWQARSFTVLTDQDDSGAAHRPILATISAISGT